MVAQAHIAVVALLALQLVALLVALLVVFRLRRLFRRLNAANAALATKGRDCWLNAARAADRCWWRWKRVSAVYPVNKRRANCG